MEKPKLAGNLFRRTLRDRFNEFDGFDFLYVKEDGTALISDDVWMSEEGADDAYERVLAHWTQQDFEQHFEELDAAPGIDPELLRPVHGDAVKFECIAYSVCVDCMFYLANGDIPEEWEEAPERFVTGMAEDIDREKGGRKGSFVVGVTPTFEDPDGRGHEEFSTQCCDLCRSTLAGSRYGATLMLEED